MKRLVFVTVFRLLLHPWTRLFPLKSPLVSSLSLVQHTWNAQKVEETRKYV